MHSVARPEGEVGHGVAILVEERLPNFAVPAPSVDDQEIKIFSAPVQNDKAKSLRFKIGSSQKRTGQPIDLIRYLSILRSEPIPLPHRAVGLDRLAGRHVFRAMFVLLTHSQIIL